MQALELSRWPTLQIGKSPPGKSVDIFIVDSANIPPDIEKMIKSSKLSWSNKGNNLIVAKDVDFVKIFAPINSKSPRSQRGILNRLLEKFKLLCREDYAFDGCNFDIRTDLFKTEVLESFMLALYEFSCFKSEKNLIKDIFVSGDLSDEEMRRINKIIAILPWVYFVQDMVNYPPNFKPPEILAETIKKQLRDLPDIKINEWEGDSLRDKFDPVWNVGKGSDNKPVVLKIEYLSEKPVNAQPVVLVGKGVCFDSGGMNAKINETLAEMKLDMAGAAAVAGICGYIASQKWPVHIVAYLPLVENLLDSRSIKASDVVSLPTVVDPKDKKDFEYIEVVDTDAEGRLLLCAMVNHARLYNNPDLIVTVATLCGTTEGMLGSYAAAAVSKVKKLLEDIEAAGVATDENYASVRVSPDMLDECQTDMEGEITDWKNYSNSIDSGDTLMAFGLIQHFAENVPFLHLDICGVALLKDSVIYKSKKRRPNGASGWGVRSVSEFLKRHFNLT